MTDPARLPITLLTGFLGSGKTTVLNRILSDPGFARTAVIVNEFGEIGIDHELVVASTETMILLQSGCMCCSLRGDLVDTLSELAERRDAGDFDFDRVVIETTGLADPAPILHTLLTSRDLVERFSIDGVVVTIDAVNGTETLLREEEARRQIALADLILLTKTDLPQADAAGVRAKIAELNASAPVVEVIDGAIDPARLFGLGHFNPEMKSAQAQAWLSIDAVPEPAPGDAAHHLDAIRSVSWVLDEPLSAARFEIWTTLLMARRGSDILRFKGLVHLKDMPHPFAVHGVQHIFHPPVMLSDWQGDDRRTKIVLILRNFTDTELHDLFAALGTRGAAEHVLPSVPLSAGTAP